MSSQVLLPPSIPQQLSLHRPSLPSQSIPCPAWPTSGAHFSPVFPADSSTTSAAKSCSKRPILPNPTQSVSTSYSCLNTSAVIQGPASLVVNLANPWLFQHRPSLPSASQPRPAQPTSGTYLPQIPQASATLPRNAFSPTISCHPAHVPLVPSSCQPYPVQRSLPQEPTLAQPLF